MTRSDKSPSNLRFYFGFSEGIKCVLFKYKFLISSSTGREKMFFFTLSEIFVTFLVF